MGFCGNCGSPVADGQKFCLSCGAAVQPSVAAGAPATPSGPMLEAPGAAGAARSGRGRLIALAAGAAVVCVALILVFGVFSADIFGGGSGTTQRQRAEDAAAKSLVRNSMTAIESGYVDIRSFDPAELTPEVLTGIEPSITFTVVPGESAVLAPSAQAADHAVAYCGTRSTYAVGTLSESGRTFAVTVDKGPYGGNQFYINGVTEDW